MEVFVYSIYLIGILATFAALIVNLYALVPTAVLMRGEHAGRYADLGASQATKAPVSWIGRRAATVDVPRARAA